MICGVMADQAADSVQQQPSTSITDHELFDRLGWFTQVRWALGAFCLLMLLVSWHMVGVRFHAPDGQVTVVPAVSVVLVMFLYNAVFTFLVHIVRARRHMRHRLMMLLALVQIFCDMIAISALIYATGGVENFFIILILVPLVIAPALLPQRLAYVTAAVAAVLINVLAWGQQQGVLPHVQAVLKAAQPAARGGGLYTDPVYVLQVTTALTATIFAIVFVASSIADRLRRREAELEEAYRRCRLVDEAKGFFMRKAGHEMRAPQAAIHSILDAIMEPSNGLDPDRLRLVMRARHRTRALMALVSDLRRYSRLRSPEGIFQAGRFCLDEVVTNTVELFRQQGIDAKVRLDCQVEPVDVEGDEALLRELVTNLVANAIQYTPAGGRIDVELRQTGDVAELTVADTGIGITEEAARRIFEEFYRSPEAKKFFTEGTGLGLAISKRIVEMHGGEIEAAARASGGSVFTVRLPLSRRGRE